MTKHVVPVDAVMDDATGQITGFVQDGVPGAAPLSLTPGGGAVSSVNGATGAVVVNFGNLPGAPTDNPALATALHGTPVAFSTTIPLDGNRVMPDTFIATAAAFIPGATANGGVCSITMIADGVHTPTFAGFLQAASSSGYDTHTVGVINLVTFWSDDTYKWYSISQPTPNTADTTFSGIVPVVSNDTTNKSGTTILLNYNVPLNTASVPAPGDFALNLGKTVTAVSVSGALVTLTVSAAYATADAPTLSYTPGTNPIKAASGASAPAFTGQAVVNISGLTTPIAFTTSGSSAPTTATNTPATGQYTYTNTQATFGTGLGVTTKALAANTDGYITLDLPSLTTNQNILLGVRSSSSAGAFATNLGTVYVAPTTNRYQYVIGSGSGIVSSYTQTAGDTMRIRRTSGNVVAEYATAAQPNVWIPIATLATGSTGIIYGGLDMGNQLGNQAVNPQASAAWA